ncbi:hypothetical protein [Sphingomonas sp. J315]|uniref:hypothetical protein n=1 Tax=Sphingomonas sp. J315 TaxID=2898433 RepID=UPI0021ADEE23|nr:hypothetical protein [Sphingomonas sp. J315]UUX99422.1 hypothetical protein LRS08_18585 [Sphingomonas sp. J315]
MKPTTRRAAFGAIGSIAAAGLIAAHAAQATASPQIERLWSATKAELLKIEALDIDDEAASIRHWNAVSALEQAVADHADKSIRASEIKLWIALNHSSGWGHCQTRATEFMIAREDASVLRSILPDLDFDAKCIAYAILALRGEG